MGIAAIFLVGLGLSAFFSGSETGFYRVPRVKLLIDALAGDWVAKSLLWATNNPALFVATALVGNNVANYVTSMGVVMATEYWYPQSDLASLLAPLAVAPVVFIYGELMPKKAFFTAPYRLLRRCVPGLGVAGVLFAPISALLWAVSRLLQRFSGAGSQTLQMELARRELAQVLDEGHAVGLLAPSQRLLAQATFRLASRPLREFMTPLSRQLCVSQTTDRRQAVRHARRHKAPLILIEEPGAPRTIVGYVRAADCLLDSEGGDLPRRALAELADDEKFLPALLRLQATNEPLALLRDARGRQVGVAFTHRLREAMMSKI